MSMSVKLPRLKCGTLTATLSKGTGHNTYGEPAWPNDILFVFSIVILGLVSLLISLSTCESLSFSSPANSFATPHVILPEWYPFATFNLLKTLSNKFIGISSILFLITYLALIPLIENLSQHQNPFRRPISMSTYIAASLVAIELTF